MKTKTRSFNTVCVLFFLISFSGCLGDGADPLPDLYEVTGVITLDGQPLGNAKVVFEPEEVREKARRRASSATTKADGSFRLYYNPKAAGATSGKHQVTIFKLPDDNEEPGDEQSIPAKYNEKTELTADVTEGDNTINFDLKSN
ncbi:DUF4198 domain-containing protein [Gimesia aquarii]|uniref:Carboxypeptidase regulatory-like domain-containing protein n=1 Tax=Gimesia aquarii TaxID=2527964 RepID=A0A517WVH8_9PLAN|nr:DUF4198 domain-containing protein [Gimesia aquarii]QDU09265.1 hypothetical protein V202x_26380 [Gimesia aquarii]